MFRKASLQCILLKTIYTTSQDNLHKVRIGYANPLNITLTIGHFMNLHNKVENGMSPEGSRFCDHFEKRGKVGLNDQKTN